MKVASQELNTFVDLEARLRVRPSQAALAAAYARDAARVRSRPMVSQTVYRYPRGRASDNVPLAPVLLSRRA